MSGKIGSKLLEGVKKDLQNFVVEYKDVFACLVLDMLGIFREVIEHKLNISPEVKPIV